MNVEELLSALACEFGSTNVVAVALFGSHATNRAGPFSDRDLIVVAEGLPSDVHTREEASPRLKCRLMLHPPLYAFNLYSPGELESAARNESWLIATIRVGYRVLFDPRGFLTPLLSKRIGRAQGLDRFVWRNVSCGAVTDFLESADRSLRAADVLIARHPKLAALHVMQGLRTQLQGDLYACGLVATRAPFDELLRLAAGMVPRPELTRIHRAFVRNETAGHTGQPDEDAHIGAARVLHEAGLPLEALAHVKAALHLAYGQTLAALGCPMMSGELTQMFLKMVRLRLPACIHTLIEASSYQIEQLDGRRRPPSFDLTEEGEPFYEAQALRPMAYEALMRHGGEILRELRAVAPALVTRLPS